MEDFLQETLLNEANVKDTLRKMVNPSDKDTEEKFIARATKKKAKVIAKGKKFDENEFALDAHEDGTVVFTYRVIDTKGKTSILNRFIRVCAFQSPKKAEAWARNNEKKYIALFKKLPTKLNEAMENKIDSVVSPVEEALFSLFEAVKEEEQTNEEISSLEESLDKEFGL
ncbi:hypothetical protein CPT_Madawaska_157 [Staphylococcus phage Madawaska]|nr:hypothetical protein CPT_Madawaska_157 [Staphylococcus phage Madawaska]